MSKRSKNPRTDNQSAAKAARKKQRDVFVPRPFDGLVGEATWIALRELVPAATAPLQLNSEYAERFADRPVTVATILPMAAAAIAKPDGRILLGLQRHQQSGDVSRDLAASLLAAWATAPGSPVEVPSLPGPGPRLQDIIAPARLEPTLHTGFEFWLEADAAEDARVRASLERANASIHPTEQLTAVDAAYWCRVLNRAHIRWVLAHDEDRALDALARLGADGGLLLGEQTKFAGMFRAHGRLIPVWDLPVDPEAKSWDAPLADFAARFAAALDRDEPLSPAARRSRQGLLGRQLTLR